MAFRSDAGNFAVKVSSVKQSEHGLFLRQFRAEAIDDANCVILIRLNQGMREIETYEKLLNADAAIHQVDLESAGLQNPVFVLQLIRRDQFARVAFLAEVIADELIFARAAVGWAKFQNGNTRFVRSAAELFVSLQKSAKKRLLPTDARQIVLTPKLLYRGTVIENVRQTLGIRQTRRRTSVILHHAHRAIVDLEIQLRSDFGYLIARVNRRQHLLGR